MGNKVNQYTISYEDGNEIKSKEIKGYPIGKFLFVHKEPFKGNFWALSHKQTGRCLKTKMITRAEAMDTGRDVKDLIDWDFTDMNEAVKRDVDSVVRSTLYPDNYIVRKSPHPEIKQKTDSLVQGDTPDKLKQLTEDYGYETVDELLQDTYIDNVSPGICMNEDCDYSTDVEPDQNAGWCDICRTNTVKSAMILAGLH